MRASLFAILLVKSVVAPGGTSCSQAPFPIVIGGTTDSTLFFSMAYNAATDSLAAAGGTLDFQSTGS